MFSTGDEDPWLVFFRQDPGCRYKSRRCEFTPATAQRIGAGVPGMLKDALDDDMDAADDPLSYASIAEAGALDVGQFRPEDIDLDVSDAGPAVVSGMFHPEGIDMDDDMDEAALSHTGIAAVVPARAYVSSTEGAPGPWPLPPSQTRKRAGAKLVAGPAATSTFKPDAQGQWPCSSCSAVYASRTGLYGHLRFCLALDAWRCEWCLCAAHHTHHKSSGPSGPKTLCSACSARFRGGHNGPPQQNDAGQFVCDQCDRPFATIAALGGAWGHWPNHNWAQGQRGWRKGSQTIAWVACSAEFCDQCGRPFATIAALGGVLNKLKTKRGSRRAGA